MTYSVIAMDFIKIPAMQCLALITVQPSPAPSSSALPGRGVATSFPKGGIQ